MLTLTRQSQLDKAKETLRDIVSYADEVVRDERLRGDVLAAIGHGAEAGDRVRADIDATGITTRLAADKKLRRKLRATLDDLDNASQRLRRKRRHRIRNVVLVAGAAAAVAALMPSARRWLGGRPGEPTSEAMRTEFAT
jgi:hypothetical protein